MRYTATALAINLDEANREPCLAHGEVGVTRPSTMLMPSIDRPVVLYKMLEAVALITDLLLLAVPLDRFRVPLPILLLVVGMRIAPLFPAFLHHLGVEGIGASLFAVIIPAALPLARGLAANQLLRMIWCRLKDLLTVRAAAIIHQAAPDQNASGSFCPEPPLNSNPPPQKITAYRNSYRVFYRVPAHRAAAHQTGRTAALLHRRGHQLVRDG
jgi:hypothetical protein